MKASSPKAAAKRPSIDVRKFATKARRSLAVQLSVAIGIGVALTMLASVVAWVVFGRIADTQERVNMGSVPDMEAAFAVSQQVVAIEYMAPQITAARTLADLELLVGRSREEREEFEERLEELSGRWTDSEGLRRIGVRGREISGILEQIEQAVENRLKFGLEGDKLYRQVRLLGTQLDVLLETAIDDQFFFMMTGYTELGVEAKLTAEHFSDEQAQKFYYLNQLKEGSGVGSQVLARVISIPDADLLLPLRESYEGASNQFARHLAAASGVKQGPDIVRVFEELHRLSVGKDGVFDIRKRQLEFEAEEQLLIARNRLIAADLVSDVQALVDSMRGSTLVTTRASSDAIREGQQLLIILNIISVLTALLIGFLWIGRSLMPRLNGLSSQMRRMAEGDLEAEVKIKGSDEVAEMAAALEVFRRHALEVQRLNLVEKLADDLKSKNSELEEVLADLRKAQDQIVMRQKLAALGELTAGVAHEIKNPLNFVKNFSEVSEELLEELLELLPDADEELDEDDLEEMEEICDDLTENLKCIRQHGDRANRIVQSMLMMGAASTERRKVDINALLKEHASLAYHSARATDPDFNLTIEEALDESVGEIECMPQGMGRVIVNMVSNACYATDEKRRASPNGGYLPTLRLKTERLQDKVRIAIWDNGTGIPDSIKEKIFNPFFTTKDTDKGTGLGLALSNDIVREHGGELRVDSEQGQYTEMIVDLPLEASLEES